MFTQEQEKLCSAHLILSTKGYFISVLTFDLVNFQQF